MVVLLIRLGIGGDVPDIRTLHSERQPPARCRKRLQEIGLRTSDLEPDEMRICDWILVKHMRQEPVQDHIRAEEDEHGISRIVHTLHSTCRAHAFATIRRHLFRKMGLGQAYSHDGHLLWLPPPPADFDRSAERLQFIRPLARRMLTIVRNARAWTTLIARGEVDFQDLSHVWIYNQRVMETEAWPPPVRPPAPLVTSLHVAATVTTHPQWEDLTPSALRTARLVVSMGPLPLQASLPPPVPLVPDEALTGLRADLARERALYSGEPSPPSPPSSPPESEPPPGVNAAAAQQPPAGGTQPTEAVPSGSTEPLAEGARYSTISIVPPTIFDTLAHADDPYHDSMSTSGDSDYSGRWSGSSAGGASFYDDASQHSDTSDGTVVDLRYVNPSDAPNSVHGQAGTSAYTSPDFDQHIIQAPEPSWELLPTSWTKFASDLQFHWCLKPCYFSRTGCIPLPCCPSPAILLWMDAASAM